MRLAPPRHRTLGVADSECFRWLHLLDDTAQAARAHTARLL
jgi:hypothetical protein